MQTYIIKGERVSARTDAQAAYAAKVAEKRRKEGVTSGVEGFVAETVFQTAAPYLIGKVSRSGFALAVELAAVAGQSYRLHRLILRKTAEEAAEAAQRAVRSVGPAQSIVTRAVAEAVALMPAAEREARKADRNV